MAIPTLGNLPAIPTAKIFISSAASEAKHRETARIIIQQILSPELMHQRLGLRLEAVFWEDFAAHIVPFPHVNDEFIEHINDSQLVIVLVGTSLRPGTAAELEKALETGGVDVALLKLSEHAPDELTKILEGPHGERVLYADVSDPSKAWADIIKPLIKLCFQLLVPRERSAYTDDIGR